MSDLILSPEIQALPKFYQDRAKEIARRYAEINRTLMPCTVSEIGDAMIRMKAQFLPQVDAGGKMVSDAYKLGCKDLPGWAISEAANDFLSGLVENHEGKFLPTSAEFCKRVRSIIMPLKREQDSLQREAMNMVRRWEDEKRLAEIERSRRDPEVQKRVQELMDQSRQTVSRQSKRIAPKQITDEHRNSIQQFKKPRKIISKLQGCTFNPDGTRETD